MLTASAIGVCWTSTAAADESHTDTPVDAITGEGWQQPIDLSDLPSPIEIKTPAQLLIDPDGELVVMALELGDRVVPSVTWMGVKESLTDYSKLESYQKAAAQREAREWSQRLESNDKAWDAKVKSAAATAVAESAEKWEPWRAGVAIALGVGAGLFVGAVVGGIAVWAFSQGGQVVVVNGSTAGLMAPLAGPLSPL